MVHHAVDDIMQEGKDRKSSKNYTIDYQEHEKTKYGTNEAEMYELYKLSLDGSHKEWQKRTSEIKHKNIYDIKSLNDINRINDNKVNNISECNLLHDILNTSKRTKILNIHYSPILHGCMDKRKGREKFKNFQILLGSGCSYNIVMGSQIKHLVLK